MAMTAVGPARPLRYTTVAMVLHWLVAALILINIFYGYLAANADGADARRLMDNHKSFGLTVLGLVVLRILWRIAHPPPPLPASYGLLERKGAHAAHILFYVVMLALPLTGYIHDSAWKEAATHPLVLFGLVHIPRLAVVKTLAPDVKDHVHDLFGAAHVYAGYVLYGLLALHLAGVAKHQAFDNEAELERMLPAGYEPPREGS